MTKRPDRDASEVMTPSHSLKLLFAGTVSGSIETEEKSLEYLKAYYGEKSAKAQSILSVCLCASGGLSAPVPGRSLVSGNGINLDFQHLQAAPEHRCF
ncbi:hypothetical protein AOLI_G00121080 [Acnodon oligacanthus]